MLFCQSFLLLFKVRLILVTMCGFYLEESTTEPKQPCLKQLTASPTSFGQGTQVPDYCLSPAMKNVGNSIPVWTGMRQTHPAKRIPEYNQATSFLRRACFFCGEQNHMKRSCRHGHPLVCKQCSRPGHKAKMCHLYNK